MNQRERLARVFVENGCPRIVQPDLVTQHENAVWRGTIEGIDQIAGGEGFVDHGPRLHRERQHDRGGPFLTG